MEHTLRDALAEVAVGFSTGLMYAPGSCVPFDELLRIVAKHDGIYNTRMRSYSWGLMAAING
jgi:hypothetical protein